MPIKKLLLSPTSERRIAEFDKATINWGWCQASPRSTPDAVLSAEQEYLTADAKLRRHVSALERKVRRLKQEIKVLDGSVARSMSL